jgi:hypothetical protein
VAWRPLRPRRRGYTRFRHRQSGRHLHRDPQSPSGRGDFDSPGFNNFTDLEVVPNALPTWHETQNHPLLLKAQGNAVSGLAVDLGYLGMGGFDLVALDGTTARLFAHVTVDGSGSLAFTDLDPGTYDPSSYPVPEPGVLAGSLVMLAAAGAFIPRHRRQVAQ